MSQSHVPHPELVVHSQNCFAPVSVIGPSWNDDLPPREFPSMCAPSNPKRLAILPCFIADSTWSAVRARAKVSLYLEMRLLDTSSCSRASKKGGGEFSMKARGKGKKEMGLASNFKRRVHKVMPIRIATFGKAANTVQGIKHMVLVSHDEIF